jgi:hypothetical protein
MELIANVGLVLDEGEYLIWEIFGVRRCKSNPHFRIYFRNFLQKNVKCMDIQGSDDKCSAKTVLTDSRNLYRIPGPV